MKRTSVYANGVIWFGAAVSVAEIEAGIQSGGNWPALILGHLLGGALLFLAGLTGALSRRNAMESAASAFGRRGARFFAALNVLQLVGWTAVMLGQGAAAAGAIAGVGTAVPCAALAALVALWIFAGLDDSFHLATACMALLAALSVFLTFRLFGLPAATADGAGAGAVGATGFVAAFELSAAMPLSWLPLISDYTKDAERPVAATAVSAAVYTLASVWMYAIGMLLARSGCAGLPDGIVRAGAGVAGLAVVVASTVTTTFLDAYSAGESAKAIFPKARPKLVGVAVCAAGAALAVSGIVDRYADFLYLVSSVFAPMAAALLVGVFVVRKPRPWLNLAAWVAGFATYQLAGDCAIGPTLASLAVTVVVALLGLVRK